MKFWKTAAATAALSAAAGIGAAVAPVAKAQSARVFAPQAEFISVGGGRIGVSVSDLDADAKGATGVRIDDVDEDSPAQKAGLRKGDVIVEFDGERVRSVRQFTRLVGETPAGRNVAASVQRDGQRVAVTITPRESGGVRMFQGDGWRALEELNALTIPRRAPLAPSTPRPLLESLVWGRNQLGVSVSELSDQLAEYFGAREGVLVTAVTDGSAAAKAGVKAGDIITSVNGSNVESGAELRRELQRIERGGEFSLGVLRDRKSMTLKGTLESGTRRSTTRTLL